MPTDSQLLDALALGLLLAAVWVAARKSKGAQTWDGTERRQTPRKSEGELEAERQTAEMRQREAEPVKPLPHKAFVVPAAFTKAELDPEDGTVARILSHERMGWVARGVTDADIIECITALWRPEPHTLEGM